MNLFNRVVVLLGVLLFLLGGQVQAEGTKQWTPTASENTYLKVNSGGNYAFAGYGVAANKRLNIHIASSMSEVVYLGFSTMVNEPANTDITTPYTFQIRSPSGAIVHGPFSVTSPNITSHAMAAAGPDALVAGGYPVGGNAMWTFTPTESGDHYIEFDTAGSIRWFDITVANSTISSAIDGRVWSQAWVVRADNGYSGLADAFDTPFTGKFVAYDGKFATQIDFAGSGIRPLEGQFSFNQTGPGSTGDIANDRKSVDGSNATNPFHKIFLNQPDPSVYPLSPKGLLQNLPLIVVNPADPKVELDVTQPGKVEMVLSFAPGNERRIFADVVTGVNQIAWDGKDGNGTTVTINDYPIPVHVSYTQGITHFTAYDVEGLDTGFEVRTQTSTGTIGPNLQFWDDSNITDAPGTADAQVNVDAGASTRRRWNQNNYGDLNTINTWWYAYQGVDTATLIAPGDYGDAPDSYGGAFHVDPANTTVHLGILPPDVENDSLNAAGGGADGSGDDADNTADEDGISTFPALNINTSSYTLAASDITVSNTSGGDATLYGFIDFNNDGDFADAGESAIANVANGATQPDSDLVFTGFTMASLEGTTYARFRISTQSGLGPDWVATDGEVEDYPLDIGPDLSNYSCTAEVDVWYANDESGSVSDTEFIDALDFIYQVTDEFYHSATDGAQGGLIGWAFDADPTNVVIPITDTFLDPDDSGLASTGTTVDGDGLGVRENYTAKVSASSGTHLERATLGLASRINAGNGRRTGVPQVAVFLTDAPNSQINNISGNGGGTAWEAAAATLRAAGPDGVRIAVILLAEAADAYDNDAASKATIDTVVGPDGIVIKTSTYAAAADPANGFIDQTVTQICSVAEFSSKDYSDAPQTGTSYGIAEHTINTNIQLGPTITEDAAAYDSPDAEGDVDDGVRLNSTTLQDQILNNNDPVTLTITATGSGRLHGWIDWDRDGVFGNNANELIISEAVNGSGTRTFSVTPPNGLTPGISYARFRYSTDAAATNPTGTANDGEVEDYRITLSRGFSVSGRVFKDINVDTINDPTEAGVSDLPVVLYDTVNGTCISTRTNASGDYNFVGVTPGDYQVYEASQESVPIPQNCGPANAKDPGGYLSTTTSVSTVFTISNTNITGIDFGDVKAPVFELDNTQTVLPNTSALHPHVFTAQTDGSVSFSISAETADPSGINWGSQLLLDTNCDGQLDSGDTAMPVSIAVTAGQQVCVLAKVLAPANVPPGAVHVIEIQSNFTYGNGSSILSNNIQTHQDITRSAAGTTTEPTPTNPVDPVGGEGKLSLVKAVWNVTRDIDGEVALPGETLRYTIYYENIGNGPLNELIINDSVPEFTQLVPASMLCTDLPAGLPLCAANDSLDGSLDWSWTTADKLMPGASGSVSYQVIVE